MDSAPVSKFSSPSKLDMNRALKMFESKPNIFFEKNFNSYTRFRKTKIADSSLAFIHKIKEEDIKKRVKSSLGNHESPRQGNTYINQEHSNRSSIYGNLEKSHNRFLLTKNENFYRCSRMRSPENYSNLVMYRPKNNNFYTKILKSDQKNIKNSLKKYSKHNLLKQVNIEEKNKIEGSKNKITEFKKSTKIIVKRCIKKAKNEFIRENCNTRICRKKNNNRDEDKNDDLTGWDLSVSYHIENNEKKSSSSDSLGF